MYVYLNTGTIHIIEPKLLHYFLDFLLLCGLLQRAKDGFLFIKAYTADRSQVCPEAATMNGYRVKAW